MTELSFENLNDVPRLLMEVELEPIQGSRFQPTGFPDLGAAVYERPNGKRMILLESAQSVANRLEQVCLEGNGPNIAKELKGLPYILVKLKGEGIDTETSSLIEAHRINSPYIMNEDDEKHVKFQTDFIKKAEYAAGKQINWKKIGETLFFYDPNSVLHGAFMVNLEIDDEKTNVGKGKKRVRINGSRIKVPRALTGFIEAEDIHEVASGGVKNNPIDPKGEITVKNDKRDVYSNVPYHRMEYTAGKITAFFNLDLALIDGFGLDPNARSLLIALSLYKIRRFIRTGLRLRTACDLKMKGAVTVTAPAGFRMPVERELLETIQKAIKNCAERNLFADPPVTELETKVERKKDEKKGATASRDENSGTEPEAVAESE